jgi:hypothetical protein
MVRARERPSTLNSIVMAGLVPAIYASPHKEEDVDTRDEPAHDDSGRGAGLLALGSGKALRQAVLTSS